ncbi:Mitochondrial carrier domain [Pseudocohnilembus persalinus]|uniref:Mitochondrial carrier domain n=1 Tax=Pseudocohnilembus persalinus TaxID=266149 RepID=A0A0V0R150_PSEPJ|nr:Mitochondrial carrier domain [Pseudocohnilembus persalinus]|eukprot:KRX08236.1 Mitochondrial carrier domain [Pseudocohnilembus persalinus]
MISLQCSVQFGIFEKAKNYFKKKEQTENIKLKSLLICSFLAGFGQSLVSTPTEYIRIQMQTSAKGQFKGNLDVVRQIIKHNGVLGVYRAWVATAIRESIGNCFYFTFYTKTLEGLQNPDKGSAYRTSVQLLAGALGGLGCWVSTFPVDVIKSRQQADSLTNPKYNSLRFCTKDTFEQLGVKGFTNGIAICLVRACFVNALTFAAFEWGKGLCEKLE